MADAATALVDEGAGQFLAHVSDLSETDRAIVLLLQEDGRRSYANIAREVGIAERTVRHRVRDLLDRGVIQITAVTNPVALGYDAAALIGITTDPAVPASDIALSLVEIEAVDYVVVTAGRYGLFAEVICRDMAALQDVIEQSYRPDAAACAVSKRSLIFPCTISSPGSTRRGANNRARRASDRAN